MSRCVIGEREGEEEGDDDGVARDERKKACAERN